MEDPLEELFSRGVEKIYPDKDSLVRLLRQGKKLRLYQGFDPSMPSLHLGNLVGLMKLRQFQKLGHEVIFLVGDFTGMIGDPTDKTSTRRMLSREETLKNSESWKKQASRILDFEGNSPVKILFNSEWNDNVSFKDLIKITSHFTVQQMIERDMFQDRIKSGKPIYLHEFLYPVAQAIDCVMMDVDLEIGGSDQTFNMLAGRTLMKALRGKEKYVLTTKLLVDAEGNKVGKTTGNTLFLDSAPDIFYGGIMSFPDDVIALSFELLTEIPLYGLADKIKDDPMEEKKRLAYEVVKLLWGETQADAAQKYFENTFQNKETPPNPTEIFIKAENEIRVDNLLLGAALVPSNSEAKRLIKQGSVDINGKTISDSSSLITPHNGDIIKIGKTKFFKVRIEE